MPPLGEAIDDPTNSDDYVAQLLAKDARDSSLKYSALGMQAYMPRRPTTGAPKPNTRFLKNILRDTDSHNAALKRKEEEEARERMRKLRAEKSSSGSHRRDENQEREAKRRRVSERDEKRSSHRSRRYDDQEDHDRSRGHRRRGDSDEEDGRHRSSRRHRRRDDDDERYRSRRHRERSASPTHCSRRTREHERSSYRRRHRRSSHSISPSRSRSRSPEPSKRGKHQSRDRETRRSRERHKTSSLSPHPKDNPETQQNRSQKGTYTTKDHVSDDDSDPLDDIIGPLPPGMNKEPPIRTRGRGAYRTNTSNIDAHFASNYDPTLDVQLDDEEAGSTSKSTRRPVAGLMTEEDDWDMALEALRDRAVWKKKGAERLREAGFGDNMVERWVNNTAFSGLGDSEREKSIEDFKWAQKGEGREWDRGKVLTEDGHVDLKAPW
ncbi:hypothetical protein Plec18167_007532 [Paecilomyces lecythidis]|uniref:Pre-mRNA-splicing factor 38B n=1 Tax=Paecilomyces lecythidis TaxID=3004212 RepID=A0ABR3X3X5_9EURO